MSVDKALIPPKAVWKALPGWVMLTRRHAEEVLCCDIMYCALLNYAVLNYTALQCTSIQCSVMHCTAMLLIQFDMICSNDSEV
jgi:hypothetical protein